MTKAEEIYDIIGIGIGPYNLGLAALLEGTRELNALFFDESNKLEWHPGMLMEQMDLQVPFLADLTTFADPTNPFTYLNYLHDQNRLYQFYFLKRFQVPRQEYNDYLQWAAGKMENLHFGYKVVDVIDQSQAGEPQYQVIVKNSDTGERFVYRARHIVMGTGTEPLVLDEMSGFRDEDVFHTNRYLYEKQQLIKAGHITIVGSGQSAAEVFLDLLNEQEEHNFHLTWLTRSSGIFQLESAKLGQEFFSPAYVDYFHSLSVDQRAKTLDTLDNLRNGIDPETLKDIYNLLYHTSVGTKKVPVTIQPMTEVEEVKADGKNYLLKCMQWQEEKTFSYRTEKVILATGYQPRIPDWFYDRFESKIEWEDEKRYAVSRNYQLIFKEPHFHQFFVLTNLEHSHGAGATNLGLAVDRNVRIINHVAGRNVYKNQQQTIFQQFRMEDSAE